MQKIAFLLVLVLSLMACASVPLGTMLKFARFDLEDLQKVDPAEIRAAIRTHLDFKPGEAKLSLKIALADDGESLLDESFILHRMPDWAVAAYRLKPAPADRHWVIYKLEDEDLNRFRVMQNRLVELEQDERGKSMTMGVGTDNSEYPEGRDTIPFAVDLQLGAADGFFTLVKEIELPLDRENDGDQESPET